MYKISQLRKCPLSNFQLATFPTEIFGMDHFFLSKRQGFTCVLLVVDIFSHFTFAFACRDESSRSVCNHLESLISITGAPKIVKSDNSLSLLRSKAVSQLLERYGVEHQSLSMSYAPRHNAVVERSVRVMRQLLKSETFGSHESWPKLLRKVCLVRNTIPRVYPSGTFASPYELFFNRKPPTPLVSPDHLLNNFAFLNKSQGEVDNLRRLILKDLTKLKKQYLESHNRKARPRLQKGDLCIIKENRVENNKTGVGKQAASYRPSLFMCKALNGTVCVLEHLASNTIHMVHADFCKKVVPRDKYFDLLPKTLQKKIGASFLIDLESRDRTKLIKTLQGAGYDTDIPLVQADPVLLPPQPEILDTAISGYKQSSAKYVPPPSTTHFDENRTLRPILTVAPESSASASSSSANDPTPNKPPPTPSVASSLYGRIKNSLRKLQRKNYKD